MKKNGFTLIELLAVIAIMGIIAGIAVPVYSSVQKNINESIYNTKVQNVLAAAESYAEDTRTYIFDVRTLIENGKIESDNELGEYIDPRTNRNMICDILNITYENNQYRSKITETNKCYDSNEMENLYGMIELKLYRDNKEITDFNGWVSGKSIEVRYNLKEEYQKYAENIEEITWNGEETKTCTKENLDDCNNYSIITEEIKTVQVSVTVKIVKDEIEIISNGRKNINVDNQFPYVIQDSIIQNIETNSASERKVEFDLSDGEGSGIKEYAVITNNNCNSDEYEKNKKLTNEMHITEFLKNNTYYICIKDNVENKNNVSHSFTVSNVDSSKPIIMQFNIKSMNNNYNDLATRLNIQVTDDRGISNLKMCISNTGYLQGCSWEDYTTGKDWTVNGSLNGSKRNVYLSVQDSSGNIAQKVAEYIPYKECSNTSKSNYSNWSGCSASCGGGTQTRNYQNKDIYMNKVCSSGTESRSCNTFNCCDNKKISGYGTWKSCSKTCGGGLQYRDVNYTSIYNGQSCGTVVNGSYQTCNTQSCFNIDNGEDYKNCANLTKALLNSSVANSILGNTSRIAHIAESNEAMSCVTSNAQLLNILTKNANARKVLQNSNYLQGNYQNVVNSCNNGSYFYITSYENLYSRAPRTNSGGNVIVGPYRNIYTAIANVSYPNGIGNVKNPNGSNEQCITVNQMAKGNSSWGTQVVFYNFNYDGYISYFGSKYNRYQAGPYVDRTYESARHVDFGGSIMHPWAWDNDSSQTAYFKGIVCQPR